MYVGMYIPAVKQLYINLVISNHSRIIATPE